MTSIQEAEQEDQGSRFSSGGTSLSGEAQPTEPVDAAAGAEKRGTNTCDSPVADEPNPGHCDRSIAQKEQATASANSQSTTTQSCEYAASKEKLGGKEERIFHLELPAHAVHKSVLSGDDSRRSYCEAQRFNGSSLQSTMKIVHVEPSTLPGSIKEEEEEEEDYVPPFIRDGGDFKDGDEF